MKKKLSVTLDDSLVTFVDSESGANPPLMTMPKAWRKVMEEAQWNESAAATSGRSRSPRSRSRGRR